jgi:ABC-type antimicrobial peptide transport system permease subunit
MQRNWRLSLAILIGVLISTTLFASANLASTATLNYMLQELLEDVPIDMTYQPESNDIHGFPNSTNLLRYQNTIENVDGVIDTHVLAHHSNFSGDFEDWTLLETTGIREDSPALIGSTITSGATTLGVNETYIMQRSSQLGDYPVGSNFTITIFVDRWPAETLLINLTLDIVGIIEFTDEGLQHLGDGAIYPSPFMQANGFIVDLDLTMLPIIDTASEFLTFQDIDIHPKIYIYLDRIRLINPFDVTVSIQQISLIELQLTTALGYNPFVENHLSFYLALFSSAAEGQKYTFLSISMPIFFIALYVGITMNDVSFSLRRREVGLYLTKGQTRQGITSMFVAEGFVTGILSSTLGLALAFVLVPYFMGSGSYVPLNPMLVGIDTVFLTFAFGVFLAVIATYWPARKAVQIPTTEAIREYTLAGEASGYSRGLAWTCLVFGAYKLIIWVFGINVARLMQDVLFTNPILSMALGTWLIVDAILGYVAPLLFFYGLTVILIKGSTRFHDYATRFIQRIMGDLGAVAAHTIRRRPGRTAAVIFISALLVGYSIQTVGIIAAQQDLVIRNVYKDIGADLKVHVRNTDNVTNMLDAIRAVPGVGGATFEFTFSMSGVTISTEVRVINVSEWINVAFWEPEWFPIQPADIALQQLSENNHSIILERIRAVELDIGLGEGLFINFPNIGVQSMEVVGYLGPEPENFGSLGWSYWLAEQTWSYISYELFLEILPGLSSFDGYILVSLQSPAFNSEVISAIEELDDVVIIESSLNTLGEFSTDVFLNANVNMMYMGLLFAYLLASLGTVVIVYLTLRERRTTTALMSARGMTYAQTLRTLMAEVLTIIGFAIIVGILVGTVVLYGLVQGSVGSVGFLNIPTLIVARFIPAPFAGLMATQLAVFIVILLGATLLPILIEAYTARYDTSILR